MDDVDGFVDYLLCRGLHHNTIRAYTAQVAAAASWLTGEGSCLATASPSLVAAYAATTRNSNSGRGQLRSALQHWYEWQGIATMAPRAVRVPRQPELVCRALEDDEARAVVKVSVGWWPHGTATLCGLYLAARRTEIAVAEWSRYDANGRWYCITGKGDRTATLPVHPVLAGELDAAPHAGPWVFPGRYGEHVSPATVWAWVKQVTAAAGIGEVSTHRLRHTALAVANDRTGDLRAVQSFARHQRPDTTAGYTRTRAQRLREISDSLDYLS